MNLPLVNITAKRGQDHSPPPNPFWFQIPYGRVNVTFLLVKKFSSLHPMVEMLVNIRADQLRADQGFIYAQCLHLNFITVTRSSTNSLASFHFTSALHYTFWVVKLVKFFNKNEMFELNTSTYLTVALCFCVAQIISNTIRTPKLHQNTARFLTV